MADIIDFDERRVASYLRDALAGFVGDPPDTEFQRGYLAAMLDVYKEAIGRDDDVYRAAEHVLAATRPPNKGATRCRE